MAKLKAWTFLFSLSALLTCYLIFFGVGYCTGEKLGYGGVFEFLNKKDKVVAVIEFPHHICQRGEVVYLRDHHHDDAIYTNLGGRYEAKKEDGITLIEFLPDIADAGVALRISSTYNGVWYYLSDMGSEEMGTIRRISDSR